jgi:RNA polymerase-binding transcription factor DksA
MHYHYLTIEQRKSLEERIRSSVRGELQLRSALAKLREPDYGTCIECRRDIEYVSLQVDPFALHCRTCSRLPIAKR